MDPLPKITPWLSACLAFFLMAQAPSNAQEPTPPYTMQNPSAPLPASGVDPILDTGNPSDEEPFEGRDFLQARDRWFYEQRAYPLGYIPSGARLNALDHSDLMEAFNRVLTAQPGLPDQSSLSALRGTWKLIGPQPIAVPATSVYAGSPITSGRVTALATNPSNPNDIYLGAAEGGLWRSTDGGLNWQPLTDQQRTLAVGSIALDTTKCSPTGCGTIYIGTGEANSIGGSSYYGAGILKSVDTGAHWTLYPGPFVGPFGSNDGGGHIGSLAVNPTHPNILLAAVAFASTDVRSGIYRSVDWGQTWTGVKLGAEGTAVLFDPTGVNAYAGLATGRNSNNGVYKSTGNFGVGLPFNTWNLVSGLPRGEFLGRIVMTISPVFPSQMYVVISNKLGSLSGLWSTSDGGLSWTREENVPKFCTDQCYYDLAIVASALFSRDIYVGGQAGISKDDPNKISSVLYHGSSPSPGAPFKWTDVSSGSNGIRLHADLHALAFAGCCRLYVGTDGGVWSTVDQGANYFNLNLTLAITQFEAGFALASGDPGLSLGGTQDNGMLRYHTSEQAESGEPSTTGLAGILPLFTLLGIMSLP